MKPIVIIGTGLAGYSAARELRKHDKQVPLIMLTQDDGANYYKPDISEALTRGKTPEQLVKKSAQAMADQLGATVKTYVTVQAIHPERHQLELTDGAMVEYSKLVLALGAQPQKLQAIGLDDKKIHQINNHADYQRFRKALGDLKRVAILGAGLIGCEFSHDLAVHGITVDTIDPIDWPLQRHLPEACGRALQDALKQKGVTWHLGKSVARVEQDAATGAILELNDGEKIQADIVLAAIGLVPNIELAYKAGLEIKGGIVVNRYLATSIEDIYALGDCAKVDGLFRPYVAPLMQAARALGKVLAGQTATVKYPALPIIVKTPACPVIVYPPVEPGEWQIEGQGQDIIARHFNDQDELTGFALTGAATKQRGQFIKNAKPLLK